MCKGQDKISGNSVRQMLGKIQGDVEALCSGQDRLETAVSDLRKEIPEQIGLCQGLMGKRVETIEDRVRGVEMGQTDRAINTAKAVGVNTGKLFVIVAICFLFLNGCSLFAIQYMLNGLRPPVP